MPKQLLVLAHGAWHDFSGFTAWANAFLGTCGYAVTCSSDPGGLLSLSRDGIDAVISYAALGNVTDDKDQTGRDLSAEQVSSLRSWLRADHGLVAVHCATVSDRDAHAPLARGIPQPFDASPSLA
jgi:hypothetical protein